MTAPAVAETGPVSARTGAMRSREALGAEERLLLLTAGPGETDPAIREISGGDLDWQRFLALAQV